MTKKPAGGGDPYAAIGEAARVEGDNTPEAGAMDDPIAKDMTKPLSASVEAQRVKNMESHRSHRTVAFYSIGCISIAFLFLLFAALATVLWDGHLFELMWLAARLDWHATGILALLFAVTTAVPLTLLRGLVRMIADETKEEGKDGGVVLTSVELIKAIKSLVGGGGKD